MRIDRLTSKLQLALSDAQSVAVGHDHPAIEPVHLLQALLDVFAHGGVGLGDQDHVTPRASPSCSTVTVFTFWVPESKT